MRSNGKLANAALVRGTVALLAAEGLVDADEATEAIATLLGEAA